MPVMRPGFASETAVARFEAIRPHLDLGVPLTRIAKETGDSERTLRRWLAQYRAEGIAGLERRPRADRGHRRRITSEIEASIRSEALSQPRPTAAAIHRRVCEAAARSGSKAPSYPVTTAILRTVTPAVHAAACDPVTYRNHYELVHRREASRPNEMWQADHVLLDVTVLDAKGKAHRPWLTAVIDDHSRAIAGYALSLNAPNALQTALALRHAIWRKERSDWPVCGIPECLYVDNGSDFTSEHIAQASIALKIRLVHSRPGRPRGRGRIERFFRTLHAVFEPNLPGRLVRGQPPSPASLSVADLGQQFEAFLAAYHTRRHGGTGQTPLMRWQANGFLPNMPESLEALDMLLLQVAQPRKVLRDGIRFQGRRYVEPTLAAFVGEQVEVLHDPRDPAEVRIYHQGNFICRGLSFEHAAAPVLDDIDRARRAALSSHRDVSGKARARASSPAPPPRQHGLKLYADDD